MRFCIIGWYGTETVGDRAILDGIFRVLGNAFGNIEVELGCLYPLLSKRTLLLDNDIFNNASYKVNINIFDSRSRRELKEKIRSSEYCVMGGGPIEDLNELKVIKFAFEYAKKHNKKTILFGCGLGPLNKKHNIKIVENIFYCSDLIIFRDSMGINVSKQLYGDKFAGKLCSIADPAILSVGHFLARQPKNYSKENVLAVNFRDILASGYEEDYKSSLNELITLIDRAATLYDKVLLIPMHTFFIGEDDRDFFAKISFSVNKSNVVVINKPLNLYDTYSLFGNADACIGIRYHSIVFQTLLNGNNYILDYTNKKTGKIISFLNDIDKDDFYKKRYFNLSNSDKNLDIDGILETLRRNERFEYSKNIYENTTNSYVNTLTKKGVSCDC